LEEDFSGKIMGKIRVLPDDLCHHIAAGEVVERPAAVVKELVENSLDAGASHIVVSFERGGIRLVRVVDNGEGMDREDALLALERHATSKVKRLEDLQRIVTYGFRGEALASISAVSRFELTTRTADEDVGTRVLVEGGVLKAVEPYGCPAGCSISVRDLFFNVPARRKFLKAESTERQHILDQLRRLALSNPHVHFELYEGQKLLWNYPATSDLYDRIVQAFEIRAFEHLAPFRLDRDGVSVHGYLGEPSLGRPSSSSVFLFINGRPFKDALIQKTIRDTCRSFVPENIYPFVVLFIEMDARDVDVNVHPTKQEVRFRNTGVLVGAIRDALSEAQNHHKNRSPFLFTGDELSVNRPASFLQEHQISQLQDVISKKAESELTIPKEKTLEESLFSPKRCIADHKIGDQTAGTFLSSLNILGVINNTYIVCSSIEGLVLVDFHAAHERLLYNQLVSSSFPLPSQKLVMPFLLQVLPEELESIEVNRGRLLLLGYDVEPFGKDTVAVRAVPALGEIVPHREILGELLRSGLAGESDERLVEKFASTVACHTALRAGDSLSGETVSWLIEKLSSTPENFTCPHGRPFWIIISMQEIAKRFGRGV
jgi:DNA mismatch repair protein MutL